MNFYFTYDEYTGISDADAAETLADELMDAMEQLRAYEKPVNILVGHGMTYEYDNFLTNFFFVQKYL